MNGVGGYKRRPLERGGAFLCSEIRSLHSSLFTPVPASPRPTMVPPLSTAMVSVLLLAVSLQVVFAIKCHITHDDKSSPVAWQEKDGCKTCYVNKNSQKFTCSDKT